jgi:hypothetical protein
MMANTYGALRRFSSIFLMLNVPLAFSMFKQRKMVARSTEVVERSDWSRTVGLLIVISPPGQHFAACEVR